MTMNLASESLLVTTDDRTETEQCRGVFLSTLGIVPSDG